MHIDGLRIYESSGAKPIIAFRTLPMTQNQFDKKSEAWSALFSEPMSDLVKRYTAWDRGEHRREWTVLQALSGALCGLVPGRQ